MEKSLLTNGKIILPEKLKINLKLNVGIIGSGKLSEDYINVAKSFDHNIKYIASLTKNKNANKFDFKYLIYSEMSYISMNNLFLFSL